VKRLRFGALVRLSAVLEILNQETSGRSPWRINDEQREVLEAICEHRRTIVLKGRQVGVSTVVLLFVVAFAIANPGVACAIVADTAEKAEQLLGRAKGWLRQLGVSLDVDNTTTITLPNGTTIDALSAISRAEDGESRVGRSKSYALLHLSEVGFWMNDKAVFAGLMATALPQAKVIIESTASAADNLFRRLWLDADNGWHHIFLSLERHAVYRRPPTDIDDATWEELRAAHGFTRRDTAAWWAHKVRSDLGSDVQRALREFPVIPDHCFAFAEGRWVGRHVAAVVREAGEWDKNGRYQGWTYYEGKPQEPVLFGVDTGAGLGADASTLAVVGEVTGRLYATFTSHSTDVDAFTDIIEVAADQWNPTAIVVEVNGIGRGVADSLLALGYPVELHTSGAEKHQRLARVKVAIESGAMPVGPEVVYEAQNSRIAKPTSARGIPVYEGRDDLLNAISFALHHRATNMDRASPVSVIQRVDPHRQFVPAHRKPKRRTY